jgi:hypothetical protein
MQRPPVQYPYAGGSAHLQAPQQAQGNLSAPVSEPAALPNVQQDHTSEKQQSEQGQNQKQGPAPADWLKPKIFKSSNVS